MVGGENAIRHHVRRTVRHSMMVEPAPHTKYLTVPTDGPRRTTRKHIAALRRQPPSHRVTRPAVSRPAAPQGPPAPPQAVRARRQPLATLPFACRRRSSQYRATLSRKRQRPGPAFTAMPRLPRSATARRNANELAEFGGAYCRFKFRRHVPRALYRRSSKVLEMSSTATAGHQYAAPYERYPASRRSIR